MAEVALLVYGGPYKRSRRVDSTFDGWDNVGAHVIRDVLERAGISVGFTTAEAAHLYKVVLVSLTSPFDVLNFIASVSKWETWRKRSRRFMVLAGGAGLSNVYPLREWVDWAVFGRAEEFAAEMVTAALAGRDYKHKSVMPLRDEVRPVMMAQAPGPYPHRVKVGKRWFKENVVGCPLKCAFCHYTYARKWSGGKASDYVREGMYGGSAEGLFVQSAGMLEENPQSRIITGLDGLSERLRFAFRKRISNDAVVNVIEAASRNVDSVRYKLYMIGSYPSETDDDLAEFLHTVRRPRPAGGTVQVMVHLTPFYASPLTPGAWLPVRYDIDWRKKAGRTIYDGSNYKVWWSQFIESPASHLIGMVLNRSTAESDDLVSVLALSKVFQRLGIEDKVEVLMNQYDMEPYVRKYNFDEPLPTWYLRSYYDEQVFVRAASRLHEQLGV